MVLDLLAIISAAGTGAVTGYLTNNLALKMIFKEYGPLGGVVIKTKDEFIDSISVLVERDLINHQSLEKEFSRSEFKNNFTQTVDDFFNVQLREKSAQKKLKEIPGWEENFELLSTFAGQAGVDILNNSSQDLKDEELEELIPETVQEKILKEIYGEILKVAESEEVLEKLILDFYEQFKEKNLTQLLTDKSKTELKNFSRETILYFKNNYQELDGEEKKQFKQKLKELFELEELSQNILEEIKNIKISDLFQAEDQLEEILDSSQIHDLLKEILVNLKIEVDNSDLSLEEFFTAEIETELQSQVSEFIYSTETNLLNFLDAEEEELNNLILEAVEAEIEASTGLKAISRQGIYNKYQENIEEYGSPLSYLKDYLKEKLRSDDQQLAAKAIEKIKKVKINKVLQELDLDALKESLENSLWDFYQQNKDKKLIELFSEEIFVQNKLKDKIIKLIFNSLAEISNEDQSLDILIDYFLEFKLKDLINKEKLSNNSQNITDEIYQILTENEFIIQKARGYLNQNFFELLKEEIDNSKESIAAKSKKTFAQLEASMGEKELKTFLNLIKDDPEAVVNFTESISSFFYNNLPELLEGKVARAAAANLHQLSDEEVQTAIEEFMGKELKPITYLGALLGALAGVAFSFSGAETAIFNASPLWVDYLSSALIYGGVGWLTNVLAIWMIFHPYQEKNIFGAQIPFTPGVVAKNRSRFADSMGKFVETELLKANSASELIEKNRLEIENSSLEYFSGSNYQQFFDLLKEENEVLADSFLKKAEKLIADLKVEEIQQIMEKLIEPVNNLLIKKVKKTDFKAVAKDHLTEDENSLSELLTELSSKLNIEKITKAAAGQYKIELSSKQLKELMKNKNLYPLFKYLAPYLLEKEIDFKLKDYLLSLLKEDSDYYLDQSLELFLEQEERVAKIINFKKDEIIETEKEKKGGLFKNTLISGAIYMADLDEFVDSVVGRVFKKLRADYFVENRDKLENLYNNLLEEMENKEILSTKNFNLNQLLKNFLKTETGGEFLTEVLYLSDDSIAELIDFTFESKTKNLLILNLKLKAEELNYFIDQELNLEQKLQLLVLLKKIFAADNLKNEVLKLSQESDFNLLKEELEKSLKKIDLIKLDNLDSENFNKIKNNLLSLLERPDFEELLQSEISEQIVKLSELLEEEMDKESLEYLLSLAIEAGVDSLKNNSEALLNSLELKELTAAEVRKMNPAEIEEIFDSFAGKYFAHLKQYGWFGGIFGVLQLLLRTII